MKFISKIVVSKKTWMVLVSFRIVLQVWLQLFFLVLIFCFTFQNLYVFVFISKTIYFKNLFEIDSIFLFLVESFSNIYRILKKGLNWRKHSRIQFSLEGYFIGILLFYICNRSNLSYYCLQIRLFRTLWTPAFVPSYVK